MVLKEMSLKLLSKKLIFFFSLLVLISSCKIASPPALPLTVPMPESYVGDKDTLMDGKIEWQIFFTDSILVKLIATGLANNLDLLTAVQRIEMTRADYAIKTGAVFPSLATIASANVGNVNQNMVGNADQSQRLNNFRDEYFIGFQSSWEVDAWGKLRNQKKAAYSRYLASQKGRHLVMTSLIAEVGRLYYELLAVDNELEIIRKNIEFQQTAVDIINIQKVGGRATELAVQQSTAQLLSTKALEKQKLQMVVELETEINLLLGRYPQQIVRGKDISEQPLPEMLHEGVPSSLLLNRPDIQQAELELEASKAELQAARAAFLPTISISPYAGFNSLTASSIFQSPESMAAGLLGSISAPLFNRNRIRSEFNYSIARRSEAFYAYQQTIIRGFGEVSNTIRRISNLQMIFELKQEEVNVLSNAVSTSNVLFTSGYATYLEVITAQKSVLEAELELANIKKEIFHSVIDLYKALGGGWHSDAYSRQ
jgi:NodT family efflux transporter outer membrane factor (OMF) lipoprotein